MPLSLGFIGAGSINQVHLKSARTLGYNLAAIADVNASAAEAAAKEFGIGRTFTDYRQMLADKDIAAIVIGTPNKFHAEHAIAALEAGKHVLLEKPMAMNPQEADAIAGAATKSGKILQMGMVNRFRNSAQALRHFIAAGRCGNLYSGQAWFYRRRGIPGFGGWFTTKAMSGGGALIDIGVHLLDLALYLMDFPKPVAVSGQTYNTWDCLDDYCYVNMWGNPTPGGKKDVDDYAMALIRFEGGQTLQLNVSWALNIEFMQPEMGLRLMGDKGGVALHGMDQPHVYSEEAGHLVDIQPYFVKNDPFVDEMRSFIDCIEQGKPPIATADQGRMVQSILDAIYRSGEEKREVRLGD